MNTRFTLTIQEIEHELGDDSVINWGDIVCAYKRSEYGGVIRSFTSQFKFAGIAYELLLDAFMRHGYQASADLSVYTQNDMLGWDLQFRCPLDFTTKEISRGTFSISAVDNSLAAKVKSGRSTAYEFAVGSDIVPDRRFNFDRIPMKAYAEYELAMGDADDNGALTVAYVPPSDGSRRIWLGKVKDEVSIGSTVLWSEDQQNDADGFVLEAYKSVSVSAECMIVLDRRRDGGTAMDIELRQVRYNGSLVASVAIGSVGGTKGVDLGEYPSVSALEGRWRANGFLDLPNPEQYFATVNGTIYRLARVSENWMMWNSSGVAAADYFRDEISASAIFNLAKGDKIIVVGGTSDCTFKAVSSLFSFRWLDLGEPCAIQGFTPLAVASRLLSKIDPLARVSISGHDPRVAKTILMAAESIRGIGEAKLRTSFSNFCDWMETVFGYVMCVGNDCVEFKHRSELFRDVQPRRIDDVRDASCTTNASNIWSTIEIGYGKKDYDKVNGRDEWNFTTSYATGSASGDKKLSLKSAYRCDCYGIEFAAQQRGKDTTDSGSDTDVFFAYGKLLGGIDYKPDREAYPVEGALNDKVFNGAYAPSLCAKANEGHIAMQSPSGMTLMFASTEGNSGISVRGTPVTADIELGYPLMTCEELEFTTTDLAPPSADELIEAEYDGIRYVGYIKEAEFKYSRETSAKYKLLIKQIET